MPVGFQVFDAAGNLKIDGSDRLARFLGLFFFGAGASGSVVIEGLTTGTPFFSATPHGNPLGFGANNEVVPSITFSGDTMYYSGFFCDQRIIVWVH